MTTEALTARPLPPVRRFRDQASALRQTVPKVIRRHKGLAAALWMNLLIGGVVLVATFTTGALIPASLQPGPATPTRAVTLFLIWTLSFVPGWLYVRFLGMRADAVWTDYVLALHRLGVDVPENLPKAPDDSVYANSNQPIEDELNIYRQKFDAYYGPNVSRRGWIRADQNNADISGGDKLFPVFLLTTTLAVAWSVILWRPQLLITPGAPWAVLEFGFLGAYAFVVSMLVRRFFQSDLRPSAYAAAVLRIVLVLVILATLHQVFALGDGTGANVLPGECIFAFVIGFFPLVGLQVLRRMAARRLRVFVPSLVPPYPLEQLDGLNVWYETRLVEEGVEDMQNLTTVTLVDVILHTRAPTGRLIDWLDQAYLYLHLPPSSAETAQPGTEGRSHPHPRDALRNIGVRSATDLVKLVGPSADQALSDQALKRYGLDPESMHALAGLLAHESGLDPVWNWKAGGIPLPEPPAAELLETRRKRVIRANVML